MKAINQSKGGEKNMKNKNPYRPNTGYALIAKMGASHIWPSRNALAEAVAKASGKDLATVEMAVDVVCNPKQKSNNGKTAAVKVGSGIRIKYLVA